MEVSSLSGILAEPRPVIQRADSEHVSASQYQFDKQQRIRQQKPALGILALTLLAFIIQGYHPYTDDAAIYVAGIEKAANPLLFPVHAEYVLLHLQHSIFSYLLGLLIRLLHIPIVYGLFAAYITSLWLMIFACWRLVQSLFSAQGPRCGAMLLIATTLTLPVAGSAIFIIDPYLTARSFSTPATILAVAFILERKALAVVLCLAAAFLLHPLMACYAVGYVVALLWMRQQRWFWLIASAAITFIAGFIYTHTASAIDISEAYRVAAQSRSYFFLDQWKWFEIFGLFPPLIAATVLLIRQKLYFQSNQFLVVAASLYVGAISILFALLFTRTESNFLLARLQPLRAFQLIYIIFFLFLGSILGSNVFRRKCWLVAIFLVSVSCGMFAIQLCSYSSLQHIEWPWLPPQNPWEKAFLWIRAKTPLNAYFAIDPGYQQQANEDTVGFRAATERSVMPDWSKDGGVAALDPKLAQQWWKEIKVIRNLSHWDDQARIDILSHYGVNWVVLSTERYTNLTCPYENPAVSVCELPKRAFDKTDEQNDSQR